MLNTNLFSRRQFLAASATSIAASALTPALAAEKTELPARMKFSLSAYSFNRLLPRNWYTRGRKPTAGKKTLFDVIDFAAATGFDAVELTAYYFPKPLDPLMASEIKRYAFARGLDISGSAIGNDFCIADGPELEAELSLARQWLEYSQQLDAPVIRIFAGKVPKGDELGPTISRCAANIRSLLPDAEKAGVVLALENHGGITAQPDDMLQLIEEVGESPWFGVNFDGGNFAIPAPYAGLEKIAPFAVNAQLKVGIKRESKGAKEPADLERTIGILRDAKYRGYVALEYEEAEDPYTAIPPLADTIRGLIDAANHPA